MRRTLLPLPVVPVLVGLVLTLAACMGTAYSVEKVADTVPFLRITKVAVSGSSTKITFRYTASGDQDRRIGVHPPGHGGAFRIQATTGTATYALTGVRRVAVLPDRTLVPQGSSREFTLVFEAIPETMNAFHVGEGDYDPESGESAWHFRDVEFR